MTRHVRRERACSSPPSAKPSTPCGSHRRWAALTMFGIVWGTASVVLLVGWGDRRAGHDRPRHAEDRQEPRLRHAGARRRGSVAGRRAPRAAPSTSTTSTRCAPSARRVELVSAEILHVAATCATARPGRTVDVRGIEPDDAAAARRRGWRPAASSRPTTCASSAASPSSARRRAPACSAARPAIGQRLNLDGVSFEVVGLLERVGTQLSRNRTETDEQIWIPDHQRA